MNGATRIKPMSYLKEGAAQIAAELQNDGGAFSFMKNAAPAGGQSVEEYGAKENTLAMLHVITQGRRGIAQSGMHGTGQAFADIGAQLGLAQSNGVISH